VSLHYSGASIFGPSAAPTDWPDDELDISAITGSGVVLAILKINQTTGTSCAYGFRPNGNSNDYYTVTQTGHGCTTAYSRGDTAESHLVACLTDASGVIEWKAGSGQTTQVWLMGWLDVTVDTTALLSGVWGDSWTPKDISGIVGAELAVMIGEWHRTAGSQNGCFTRPKDDPTGDWQIFYSWVGGSNIAGYEALTKYCSLLIPTDDSGQFDYIANGATVEATLTAQAYFGLTAPTNSRVFAADTPPSTYEDLDLTTGPDGVTGISGRSLVLLKFHLQNTGTPSGRISVRAKDDAGEYYPYYVAQAQGLPYANFGPINKTAMIVCLTDENGVIQWKDWTTSYDVDVELVGFVGAEAPPVPSQYRGPTAGANSALQGPAKGTAATNRQGQVYHEDFINRMLVQRQRGAVLTDDGTLFSVPGQITCDGDNYITYSETQWPLGKGVGTIFFRGQVDGLGGLGRFFGTSSSLGDGYEWRTEFVVEGSLLKFVVSVDGTARDGSTFAISLGTPFTAACVVSYDSGADETTITTYFNGVLVGAATYSGAAVAPDQGWTVGRWNASELDGVMTQMLMYNRAYDAASIATIHAGGA
jgi:hypothetical protein